ncbi:hypothetical protein [Flammeovirga sp. SubArs3]|uniref:hypothetical protein n=1 Tax=Flammeovirga sp. SubArs3 TaxID=2995316 RepID=UPI00248CB2C3|nr:hypothetical protein [Flammeovirga sp. SubArs3]
MKKITFILLTIISVACSEKKEVKHVLDIKYVSSHNFVKGGLYKYTPTSEILYVFNTEVTSPKRDGFFGQGQTLVNFGRNTEGTFYVFNEQLDFYREFHEEKWIEASTK